MKKKKKKKEPAAFNSVGAIAWDFWFFYNFYGWKFIISQYILLA